MSINVTVNGTTYRVPIEAVEIFCARMRDAR
jgi:hypothetical protein